MEKIATVPYAQGQAYDFYEKGCVIDGEKIRYDDIKGFGLLLTHKSNSVNLVPISNSTSFSVEFDLGDRIFHFGRSSSNAMLFKSKKQKTIDLVYSEVVKCIEALIAPRVLEKCLHEFKTNGQLKIGDLTITTTKLIKKGMFGSKELPIEEYTDTRVNQGRVSVLNKKGKAFYTVSLSGINAPLIQPIMDILLGIERQ